MTAGSKSNNFLLASLISVVSSATLASGATAMPATETSLSENLISAYPEVSGRKNQAKNSISGDLNSLGANQSVHQSSQVKNDTARNDLEVLASDDKGESEKFDRITSVSLLSQIQPQAEKTSQAEIPSPGGGESKVADSPLYQTGELDPLESLENGESEEDPLEQVTSVSQLSDVQPTDWAFQALQSLVERYGCIEGYPDRTYRGNRAITRYEFAAGLNACLDRIQELIAASSSKPNNTNFVTEEDLASLRRLQEQFATELASLKGRVDTLEARTAKLEATQFSTTTKLFGNVRFQLNSYFAGADDSETIFQYSTFLGFLTSFTGRDLLITALAATNTELPELTSNNAGRNVGSTREGTSDLASPGSTNNEVRMITLAYQFPIGEKLKIDLIAFDRYRFNPILLRQFLPYYSIGGGPVSAFLEAPPLYFLGGGGGISASYEMFDNTVLTLTYLGGGLFVNNPAPKGGLFNGDYIASAQINYNPSPRFFLQGIYQHGYFGTRRLGDAEVGNFAFNSSQFFRGNGFVGSALANRFDDAGVFFEDASEVTTNAYQLGGYFAITPRFIIGGWVNYINAKLLGKGTADIWTYSVQAAFPDLFKKGNLAGLGVGMEPTLTGLRVGDRFIGGFENDTSLHVEAYYKYQVTNNISITPSVIWITAPNQDADNEDIVIGGIRTTFNF
ncbi:MAG TPA: iron uptake porin [Leptolyngbyaceae cyanobacterium]